MSESSEDDERVLRESRYTRKTRTNRTIRVTMHRCPICEHFLAGTAPADHIEGHDWSDLPVAESDEGSVEAQEPETIQTKFISA